jgi:serine/threonine protein kinase
VTDYVGQHFGNYQLVKLLGQGGCAKVYLGKHRYLNSYAALKVLHTTLHPGDEHTFLAEAQTLVNLRHSNIIHLLDFGIENGTPVLIMDYAPNGSLRQQYPQGTLMPLTTVADVVTQIATALQYAHNHHVIHRDVKPENILLDADNHLLLSDFGLSLLTPSAESLSTQDPAGTPRYMAPEQLRGKPCFASDQYALAVMVYEWLCGNLPFRGNMWEIWQQHLYTAPSPLRPIRPELSLRLENVVLRALAKKPEDRFVSIQTFAGALARASQTSTTPVEEDNSQTTAPLQVIIRSSPIASLHQATPFPLPSDQIAQLPTRGLAKVPPQQAFASTLQNQNRVRMLRRLRRSYSELMSQSLQGATWLDLGIASRPDAVQNVAHLLLHVPHRAVQHLPAGTSIIQAYDEAEHELLILGEPGAGKSTLLLNLAQQLVIRAEQNETHPLPVLLPLSSWAVKRPPLQDWIAEQLTQLYDVPHKLSVQWVQEDAILPLLDGLDEMEEKSRTACITAINAYHRDHMSPMAVCSRTTEYETASSTHRLILQGAIVVQPLTPEDVEAYLVQADKSLTILRSALKKNTALHDLATTPLMLNILILTYQGTPVHNLADRQSLPLQQVWNDFIERMVTRKGDSQRYPLKQTRAWLSWMARQMREHNQTVFYLEHLQPDWLTARQQLTYAWRAVRWPAILIGSLVSVLIELLFFGDNKLADFTASLEYAARGGLLGGLWNGPTSDKGSWRGHHTEWGKHLIKRLAISACLGLIGGLSLGFHLSAYAPPGEWQVAALYYGVTTGLSALLLQYLLTRPLHPDTSSEKSALQRLFQAVQGPRALLVAFVTGLFDTLTIGQFYEPTAGLRIGLSYGVIYGLISLALSAQMEDVRPTERLRWSWRSLRKGLLNSKHLRIVVLLTIISIIFAGLSRGLSAGLSIGLSTGLSYWCLLGLFQGIAQEQIENQDRRTANQGIHRSLRHSVMMSIIGGTTIGIIGILKYGLSLGLTNLLSGVLSSVQKIETIPVLNYVVSYGQQAELISGPSSVLSYGLQLGITGALLIYMLTGGLAILRHYTIRLLLWRSHTFPWQAAQFLDDATARFLLRRVGGGYSFTHRLLLDHLADEETGTVSNANGPSRL